MTPEAALEELRRLGDPERAAGAKAYHKSTREHLGVPNPVLNDLARDWRAPLEAEGRVALAKGLWDSDVFEARVLAAKLLTTAAIRPDDTAAWDLIASWVPDFDGWAIADHACMAGAKRVMKDPTRIDTVAQWVSSDHLWTKRAALVVTLPFARLPHPKPAQAAIREQVLGWAAEYVPDRAWFIQKAVAWWLRDLSKHDADRVRAFLAEHGVQMKPFARKEAAKYLSD